jgi:hypothetical protein
MRISGKISFALVCLVACGGKREPAPGSASATASASGSGAPVAPVPPVAPPPDAASPDAPSVIDAAPPDAVPDAAIAALTPMTTVPEFGCIAAAHGTAACVIGSRGENLPATTKVTLVFVGSATAPAITLLTGESELDRGADALPAAITAQVAEALHDYAPLDRAQHLIAGKYDQGKLPIGPALSVAGMTISLTAKRVAERGEAPTFQTVLSVQRGGKREVLEDSPKAVGSIEVRAFALGDAVVVEQRYFVHDEGEDGDTGQAWRCDATECAAAE